MQELVKERESIQAEYDALENDYTLVQLELRAARERISRLMGHLERSEQLVAFAQEERDALQHKVFPFYMNCICANVFFFIEV